MENVATRVLKLRQQLGISQRAFGQCIERSGGYISKVEKGIVVPPDEVISRISEAYGVPEKWFRSGEGSLEGTDSVGERVKQARKFQGFTQEELAEAVSCSRNSIGLIEREQVRPGGELSRRLAEKLNVSEAWLMTGQGRMDRANLGEVYGMIRQDPEIRRQIKEFISRLEREEKS